MRINSDFIHRQIAGEHILVPAGKAALKLQGMIGLTESGYLLCERLRQDCTEQDLVDALLEEYDVREEEALADVAQFLAKLRRLGILQE